VLEAYQIGREVLKTINDDMLTAAEEVVDELHEVGMCMLCRPVLICVIGDPRE
jgi:hypothetical protein